jgi:hypothetical protein
MATKHIIFIQSVLPFPLSQTYTVWPQNTSFSYRMFYCFVYHRPIQCGHKTHHLCTECSTISSITDLYSVTTKHNLYTGCSTVSSITDLYRDHKPPFTNRVVYSFAVFVASAAVEKISSSFWVITRRTVVLKPMFRDYLLSKFDPWRWNR